MLFIIIFGCFFIVPQFFRQTKKTLQIIQIQILDWKLTGACANFKIITDVNEEVVKVQRRTGNKAIVVHCRCVFFVNNYVFNIFSCFQ